MRHRIGYGLAGIGLVLCLLALAALLPDALTAVPDDWTPPMRQWTGDATKYVTREMTVAGIPFQDITRAGAELLRWPMEMLQRLLTRGFGDSGVPPLSWLSVIGLAALLGYRLGGLRLAMTAGGALAYCALFGIWRDAMLTLASVGVSVAFGVVFGVLLGVAAWRRRWIEAVLTPIYDLMQTVPIFAYLVPVLLLFGFGPVGSLVATVVYALPPMARVTTLALDRVPAEIGEFATMAGVNERQRLWRVLLPAARADLLIGLNQVIMLSFTMVIISSVIGAGGLGGTVLKALQSMRFGLGLEAGLGITVIAIALDRLSRAAALKRPVYHSPAAVARRRRNLALAVAALVVLPTALLPADGLPPAALTITTAPFWDGLVSALNLALASSINDIKTVAFGWFLRPTREFVAALPWTGLLLLCAGLGWHLRGPRLAASIGLLGLVVVFSGFWPQALLSLYLILLSVALSLAIGMPIGVLAARHDRLQRLLNLVMDTIQTLPSFIYLIPIVMIFGPGEFSALIAIVAYAVTPAIRYTDAALRGVPAQLVEAGRIAGATPGQQLRLIDAPVARPALILAVNQTVMMAFGMLVISALVGTRGLEQDTLLSLSKADPGRGIVAGAAMAALAMIIDRLLSAWAARGPSGKAPAR